MKFIKFFTPLEQFEITVLEPLNFLRWLDISFSTTSLFLLLVLVVTFLFFNLALHNARLLPSFWQSISESVYIFLLTMLQDQATKKAVSYFPFIFLLFIFILA